MFNLINYLYKAKSKVVAFYDGKSELNGEDILGFLYLKPSENSKVKGSYYTTYLNKEVLYDYHTEAVCGNCSLVPYCYTRGYMQNPPRKWIRDYLENNIPLATRDDLKSIQSILPPIVRFGMHGDPASVPFSYTEMLLDTFKNVTSIGYTHQWEHSNYDSQYDIFHKSMEFKEQKNKTTGKSARVILDPKDKTPDEIICPHDLHLFKGLESPPITCGECKLCDHSKNNNIAFLPKKGTSKFKNFLNSKNEH